ncbi:hypothetical protein BOX37_07860 [Nocardia mangyaensis]|uniref:Uncharacterized protein n=1 Tax=Nocardia mangyaensis TaxID=2213200 RepID=A0A1J0VPD8_9NOCA|nr:hypothetical protein [Nocardia mangyaensis]APE33900.1 hypothetical protein BOX37_07860 [Nocardia mangyaensis]
MSYRKELFDELSFAVRRTGVAIGDILSDAGRSTTREVVDLVHEGRELVAGAMRAQAAELRRRGR